MKCKTLSLAGALTISLLVGPAGHAWSQVLMGSSGYDFPASNTFAAQAQISQRLNSGGAGASSGMQALSEYINNSSSTAIGSYSNVTVGNNSQASVNGTQTTQGNQGSTATTDLTNKTKATLNGGQTVNVTNNGGTTGTTASTTTGQ